MVTELIATTQAEKKRAPQHVLPRTQVAREPRIARLASLPIPIAATRRHNLFSEALLEMSSTRPPRRTVDLFLSIVFHTLILLALLVPPLYFTDTIDVKGLAQTFLVAPPPPPPPPPTSQAVPRAVPTPRRVLTSGGKLMAPSSIPQRVVILREEPLPPDIGAGVEGGIPGGVPGGQLGGVIGGIISGGTRTYVPVPTLATSNPRSPIRVGGRVRPPRALAQLAPVYPTLAKQARLEGTVSIDAVIDTEGNVVAMRVVSGHPLLLNAALAAVRQWKYAPTYLNDQPIAVQLIVTVTFKLDS
jgi:periplasmic protein TonB